MGYQQVKDKLYHGHRKIANNTNLKFESAYYEEEHITMTLHGNLVAMFHPTYLELYSAGWRGKTTKNRLNLALELAGIHTKGIFQKDWQWYYGNLNPNTVTQFEEGMRINYDGTLPV